MTKDYYIKIRPDIPKLSGVYIFKDASKRPLYVGKASNLQTRLKSYFERARTPMIAQMLEKASTIEWQTTLTDIEALILESQLIKKLKPPYNLLMRDDKQYFYVIVTKEIFPRFIISHQPHSYVAKQIIGPFTDGGPLRLALKNLRKIFPYCTCKQKHHRPCLNYHIGNCLGFCCLKDSIKYQELSIKDKREEYQKNIQAIREILSGKKTVVVQKLIQELKQKESGADFETASKLRIQIMKLERFFQNTQIIKNLGLNRKTLLDLKKTLNLQVLPKRIEGYDISNIGGLFATGSMVVFTDGLPDKNEYRKFKIKTVTGSNDTAMLREVFERRLRHSEWPYPDLILVDGGKAQVNAVSSALSSYKLRVANYSLDIPVIGITKNTRHLGERITLANGKEINFSSISDATKNLLLQIDSEAHRFAISYYRKRHTLVKVANRLN